MKFYDYDLIEEFQNKNAGFSRWTFGEKEGQMYFIKEFMNPVYPLEESLTEQTRKQRIRECEEYELKKKHLYDAVNAASDGHLVRIEAFFRYNTHYYVVTKKVTDAGISRTSLLEFPFEDRLLLCRTITHGMMQLHEESIVHADIKSDNILLERTSTGKIVGRIIDFDCGFFEDAPPVDEDELGGDQIYLAPESCRFLCGEEVRLNRKVDVFALGLLFHEYLTGKLPGFDEEEYDYAHEAVLDDQELQLSDQLPEEIAEILRGMLISDPAGRYDIKTVFDELQKYAQSLEDKRNGKEPEIVKLEEYQDPTQELGKSFFHTAGNL